MPYLCIFEKTIMAKIHLLTYNPFQQNTILVESGGECLIIDPGAYSKEEQNDFLNFISLHKLNPTKLLNTHCHLDHVFSNGLVAEKYGLELEIHEEEIAMLRACPQVGQAYGIPMAPSPEPTKWLKPGDKVSIGDDSLQILFTPGHSPGSVSFYSEKNKFLIAGDVLFYESIGRTDLPGGDFNTLLQSIKNELLPLDNDVVVYSGHGPTTTIGHERNHNPFIRQYLL